MSEELTERQKEVKEWFIEKRKYWNEDLYGAILKMDPDFVVSCVNFVTSQWKNNALSPKVREFIYIAIDASTTHLHELGTRQHIRNALDLGATREELIEVLELITGLGIHSVTMGIPILEEELGDDTTRELTERQKQVKEWFLKERGFWSDELYGSQLRMDPDFLEAFVKFITSPWKDKGVLLPKVREFLYIAIDAATTHLHESGTRQHMRNALKFGATREELIEVLECLTALGLHSVTMGMPILAEELKRFAEGGEK